jgi:hypothetical protein
VFKSFTSEVAFRTVLTVAGITQTRARAELSALLVATSRDDVRRIGRLKDRRHNSAHAEICYNKSMKIQERIELC